MIYFFHLSLLLEEMNSCDGRCGIRREHTWEKCPLVKHWVDSHTYLYDEERHVMDSWFVFSCFNCFLYTIHYARFYDDTGAENIYECSTCHHKSFMEGFTLAKLRVPSLLLLDNKTKKVDRKMAINIATSMGVQWIRDTTTSLKFFRRQSRLPKTDKLSLRINYCISQIAVSYFFRKDFNCFQSKWYFFMDTYMPATFIDSAFAGAESIEESLRKWENKDMFAEDRRGNLRFKEWEPETITLNCSTYANQQDFFRLGMKVCIRGVWIPVQQSKKDLEEEAQGPPPQGKKIRFK